MPELKTKPTADDVDAFLTASPHIEDARALAALMGRVSGEPPTMWGPAIVGFGTHHYRYESGREGATCRIGFAPRKAELVLYGLFASEEERAPLDRLGRHRTGKGCLYIKRLDQIDMAVLEEMIRDAWQRRA